MENLLNHYIDFILFHIIIMTFSIFCLDYWKHMIIFLILLMLALNKLEYKFKDTLLKYKIIKLINIYSIIFIIFLFITEADFLPI